MARRIWKYELGIVDSQRVFMQIGAEILSVQKQKDSLVLWAAVDPSKDREWRFFQVFGTGAVMDDEYSEYIGTVQMMSMGNLFAWHVYEFSG